MGYRCRRIRRSRLFPCLSLVGFALAAAVLRGPAPAADASRLAGILGPGSTELGLVNLDPTGNTDALVTFYPQGGGAPIRRAVQGLEPFRYKGLDLYMEEALTKGAYAAVVTADRPLTTLTSTHWFDYGGRILHGDLVPSTAVLLPWVTKRLLGTEAAAVQVSIQNTAAAPATATFDLMASGSTTPSASATLAIGAGASVTVDLARHPDFAGLPDDFVGWGRVRSAVPLAVVAHIDIPAWPMSVFAVEGIPERATGEELTAPMVMNAPGERSSWITVLNPANAAVEVGLTYAGISGPCAGRTFTHDRASIGAGGIATFYQGDAPPPGAGRSPLPADCAAAARITATGPVAAVALVAGLSAPPARRAVTAYGALRDDQSGRQVLLPLIRRNRPGNSIIHVVNLSSEAATVTLEYASLASGRSLRPFTTCGTRCRVTIPAGGGHRWDFTLLGDFDDLSFGTARLTGDKPLLATVFELNIDRSMMRRGTDIAYNGTALDAVLSPAPSIRPIPLVLRRFGDAAPTRTPAPTSPVPTATPRDVSHKLGSSTLMVTNLSATGAADIAVDFSSQTGGPPVTIRHPGIAAGDTAYLDLSRLGGLADGVYAARVRANQPVAAVARTVWWDWCDGGHALMYNAPEAGTEVVLSSLFKPYSGPAPILTIQNTADQATTAVLRVMKFGETAPLAALAVPLDAGAATTFALDAHPFFARQLPNDAYLWGRVTADQPVAVLMTIWDRTEIGVSARAGQPAASARATWIAPMVFSDYAANPGVDGAHLDSGIQVLNPGPSTASVKVTYRGAEALGRASTCQAQTVEHDSGTPVSIPPGGSHGFGQYRPLGGAAGPSGLPADCAAAAVIEAEGGRVFARVGLSGRMFSEYGGIALDQGSRRVHLPFIRRQIQPMTLIQVQNLGAITATVALAIEDEGGRAFACGGDCEAAIPPLGAHLWWPSAIAGLPDNFSGSALVTSDQPVAAVVTAISHVSPGWLPIGGITFQGILNMASYRGVADTGRIETALPLLLKNGRFGTLAPTLGPAWSVNGGGVALLPALSNP